MAAGPPRRTWARQVGELTAALVEPVLARKAGMSLGLLSAWPEIVGPRLAGATRPERLQWPPQRYEDEPFRPATLIVACEGAFVLRLQHESGELVQRLNAYFGYHAVGSLRIVQRAVTVRLPTGSPPGVRRTASSKNGSRRRYRGSKATVFARRWHVTAHA